MAQQILVVDDELAVTDLLAYNLRKANYSVLTAADGREALNLARQAHPDLILLDLMLPEIDGFDVCRELRKTSDVPIIMLTARGEEIDRVVGLELGADDYISKPFSVRELMARIKAVLRRTAPTGESEALLRGKGGLCMQTESHLVTVAEVNLPLTHLEFELLKLLLINAGRVLTRERLLEQVWGYDFSGDTRAVDSAVKRLRAKLRATGGEADSIEAVRGVGYRLNLMKNPTPLRAHLFWNTLAILLLGMGVAAYLSWRAVATLYLDTQRENLLAQANLTAAALQGQSLPDISAQPYLQTTNTLPGIHTHLFADQGAVLVNLPIQPGEILAPPAESSIPLSPQDLLKRTEIAQAMHGQAATAVRMVINRPILYAAAPIWAADGSVNGLIYLAMPLPASGLPSNLLLEWAAAALVAVIAALIAGTLLSRRIIAPVETISRAASAVSAGNLNQRVPTTSEIRELNALGQAFNAMTENLLKSEQAQNSFVADVAHELRTPMTVIKGTIETLEDGALDDLAGRGPLLVSMQRETDRLIRLVNDLLVLTRAGAGTLNLEIEPLDLVDLARARCAYLSSLAARRQVCLEVAGADSAWVMGDTDRLSQALDNLLDNAIRYSSEGSTVSVEIRPNGSECQCTVRDCGAGIPEKHLAHIFDRFYRADASRNRQTGGAGLGLTIVQALILAQGGQISAESTPGIGTSICFSLPIAQHLTEY